MLYNENYWRTLGKMVGMRVLYTCIHIFNVWMITGSLSAGLKVAGLAFFVNPVIYWLHERAWNAWQWGRFTDTGGILGKFHSYRQQWTEGFRRSIGKDLTWRVFISFSNFALPYFVTGSFGDALAIFGFATLVNMTIYFVYERVWNFFGWGRQIKES